MVLIPGADAKRPARDADMLASLPRRMLPAHKVPASLRVVPALDVAPSGKLRRAPTPTEGSGNALMSW